MDILKKINRKGLIAILLAVVMILPLLPQLSLVANAGWSDNAGTSPGTSSGTGNWYGIWVSSTDWGMRISLIDVSNPARNHNCGNLDAQGRPCNLGILSATKDITMLSENSPFVTCTEGSPISMPSGESVTLASGGQIYHTNYTSKHAHRTAGYSISSLTAGNYEPVHVTYLPCTVGPNIASSNVHKEYILGNPAAGGNLGIQGIADLFGIDAGELRSGKYKILTEPVVYFISKGYKYALTPSDMLALKRAGIANIPQSTNVVADHAISAFFLEFHELGWDSDSGSSITWNDNIAENLRGMHIYAIVNAQIKVIKLDADTNSTLAGAKFALTKPDGTTTEATVGSDGSYTWDNLEAGTYTITETEPPSGYELASPVSQTVTINDGDTATHTVTFKNSPTPTTPTTPEPGDLEIIKLDAGTNTPLAGAIFEIKNAEGSVVAVVSTDGNGQAKLTLPEGYYSVTEITPPAGYTLDENPHKDNILLREGETTTVTFSNYKKCCVHVYKYDSKTNELLNGAQFTLSRKDEVSAIFTGVTGESKCTDCEMCKNPCDADGVICFGPLDKGWYTIREVNPAPGYILDPATPAVQTFEVTGKEAQEIELKFDNKRRPELKIIKKDPDGNHLSDVEFEIWKSGTQEKFSGKTDGNGEIYIEWDNENYPLSEGSYSIREINVPAGYVLSDEVKEVMLVEQSVRSGFRKQ